jgi:hypothetical protein
MSPSIVGCCSSTFRMLVSCSFLTLCLCSLNYFSCGDDIGGTFALYITNFMGHDLAIIIVQNLFFIGLYRIDMNVIHLLILFEYWCCVHCFNTNIIYLFILFKHRCYMFICVVYTQKSCTWPPCLNDTHPWNNIFCRNLEWTHEAYIFVMCLPTYTNVGTTDGATLPFIIFWTLASMFSYSLLTLDLKTESILPQLCSSLENIS